MSGEELSRLREELARCRAELLRKSDAELLLRAIFEGARDAILLADDEGRYLEANPAACRIFGVTRQELLSRKISDFTLPDYDVPERWSAFMNDGAQSDLVGLRRPNGSTALLEYKATANVLPGRHLAILRDVTEREAERRAFEDVVLASPIAIYSVNLDGVVTLWNPAAEKLLGWSQGEIVGKPAPMSESERPGFLQRIQSGVTFSGRKAQRLHKDGNLVEVSLSRAPIRDGHGKIVGALTMLVDRSERQALQKQLIQAQKVEAVGSMAGGIAHDFNNLLGAIMGYASMARDSVAPTESVAEDLRQILNAAERAAALTRRLLAISKHQSAEPRVVDVARAISELAPLLSRLLGERWQLGTELGKACRIEVDPTHLEQILLNLVVNARDAMPRGGEIRIASELVVYEKLDWVSVSVIDAGVGMPEEIQRRALEPFFTTKGDRGTGLGLATVSSIVTAYGGHVRIQSKQGQGTTVSVLLRATTQPVTRDRSEPVHEAPSSEDLMVLLVEDDPIIRKVLCRMLERSGCRVVQAAGPEVALAEIDAGRRPHVVVCDVILPGMSGPELAQEIQERIDVAFVYMSGYSGAEVELPPGARLLQKPFHPSQLVRAVEEARSAGVASVE